jgi:uncharacterized membrane protein YdjX (TVP38/TMEM64 family)
LSENTGRRNGAVFLSVALRAAGLVLFLIATMWVIIRYQENVWRVVTHSDELQAWVGSYGKWGPVVFLGVQMVQVVVFVIPGEVVQAAGGYLFGGWLGAAYCMVGALIGSTLAFFAAKWLGRPFVQYVVDPARFARLEDVLNRRAGIVTVLVLYVIPGIPKDVLCYVAGVTPIHAGPFLLVSTAARLPGMILSVWFGRALAQESYIELIVVSVLAALGLVLGVIFRRRIEAWVSRKKSGRE